MIKKVIDESEDRLEKLVGTFISRSKQKRWAPNDVLQKATENTDIPSDIQIFYRFAVRCYREYERIKKRRDYNDILRDAIETIHHNHGDCVFKLE